MCRCTPIVVRVLPLVAWQVACPPLGPPSRRVAQLVVAWLPLLLLCTAATGCSSSRFVR